ncbi:MAG: VOC family protein [Gemmatimonadota bacterium]
MIGNPHGRIRVHRIFETSLYGSDVDELRAFYGRVLGLSPIARFGSLGVALRCGQGVLLLFDPDESAESGGTVPPHGARGPGHVAFTAAREELPAWRTHLADCGVSIETEVEWEDGHSIYFRDPAGNSVELATPRIWGFEPEE